MPASAFPAVSVAGVEPFTTTVFAPWLALTLMVPPEVQDANAPPFSEH